MSEVVHYLFDRVMVTRDKQPVYAFRIKGGVYADWRQVYDADKHRYSKKNTAFLRTQAEYNGRWE